MRSDPTLIGSVQDVAGTSIRVFLVSETSAGLIFFRGESYRVGQVGSFVRIPLGYTSLFGIVSQVGAGAAPVSDSEKQSQSWSNQWLRVELVGERGRKGRFERGVSQHPTINDPVHIVTEEDLREIYGPGDPVDFVTIGHLASAESIPALVNINRLVTRHSAIVGTTGSGKSTTVAGLLSAISDPIKYPSARVVVLDIHGEYAKALKGRSMVYRIAPNVQKDEKALRIPFWALRFDELLKLSFGDVKNDQTTAVIADAVVALKREGLKKQSREGIDPTQLTVDSPVPFCIHKLWYELHQREHRTVIPKPGAAAEEVEDAYVLDDQGNPIIGDAMSVAPPQYRTIKTTGKREEQIKWGPDALGIRQQLALLASRLRDPQLDFLLNPGEWRPDLEGSVAKDLDSLLEDWIGSSAPVTILDLSGIPSLVLNDLIGALLRILYDAIFWSRKLPEGGFHRPLLLVLEEAHTFLGNEHIGPAAAAVRRIAKEGRKYGVGLMIVSQRPSEIDPTILSQCGTIIAMRLANDKDRGQVTGASADNLKGLFDMLPILRTGEAIVVGEAVTLPIRTLVDPPDARPDSEDPTLVVHGDANDPARDGFEGEGGWATARSSLDDYSIMLRQWRMQSPHYEHKKTGPNKGPNDADKGDQG